MHAKDDLEYEKVLKSADLALVDGIGLVWAGKMFGKSFKGRVHGSDLVDKLSGAVAKKPITVGFLGGYGNVAQRTAERLAQKYPGLKVALAVSEWPNSAGPVSLHPHPTSSLASQSAGARRGSPALATRSNVTPHSANSQSSIVNGQLSCGILL